MLLFASRRHALKGDTAKPKEFIVACPNGAGDPVVIYSFVLTPSGWRFRGLENRN